MVYSTLIGQQFLTVMNNQSVGELYWLCGAATMGAAVTQAAVTRTTVTRAAKLEPKNLIKINWLPLYKASGFREMAFRTNELRSAGAAVS